MLAHLLNQYAVFLEKLLTFGHSFVDFDSMPMVQILSFDA